MIFLTNVDADSDCAIDTPSASIQLKPASHQKETFHALQRNKSMAGVTAKAIIQPANSLLDFPREWAFPFSKYLQSYCGRFVDVAAWATLDDSDNVSELHISPSPANPYSSTQPYARRRNRRVEWESFLGSPLDHYLQVFHESELGAVSQYIAMSSLRPMTVNAKSALLILATELMASTFGSPATGKQNAPLLQKVVAALNAKGVRLHKAKRKFLDYVVRTGLRNPLFHSGLPDPAGMPIRDNARINGFLQGLCIALHSVYIGLDEELCFQFWDKELFSTPSQWLEDDHTPF